MAEVALAAVEIAITTCTSLISHLKDDRTLTNCSVLTLKLYINEAWKLLKFVGESQLQGNEINGIEEEAIKTLTQWCYDAEDLVDRKLMHQGNSISGIWQKLTHPDEILKACEQIQAMLTAFKKESHPSITTPNFLDGGSVLDTLFGRERDIDHIVEMLLSCHKTKYNGISIVGMYGLGKSLLARTILKHDRIVSQFSCTSWAKVKDGKFVWDTVMKDIESNEKLTSSANNQNNTKLLVLIDDLQDTDSNEWLRFINYRKEVSKDITIMVTTRNPTISETTGTALYDLGLLSEDSCVEVIKQNATIQCPSWSLPDHRIKGLKTVAKKCEGLPLVSQIFGLIIGGWDKRNDDKNWDKILNVKRLSQESKFKKEIFSPLMSSSYKNMKTELWRCVAYLSLFPSGHHFDIEDLVSLWVGECFVPFEDQSGLKGITEKYIDDLKRRLIFVQSSGILYKLHSLGEDIALSASSETCQRLEHDDELSSDALPSNLRHLSFFINPTMLAELIKGKRNLRTFLSLHDQSNSGKLEKIPYELHKSISSVRVLSLKGTNITELPSFIGKLKHLRYLDISFTLVKMLPTEVCSLRALQFLKLKESQVFDFPVNFHKLTNLIYVDWDENYLRLLQGLCKIGKLSKLENLPLFKVGNKKKRCSISELKEMNKLQGSLHIQNLENVTDTTEAKEAMLHKKDGLVKIGLQWNSIPSDSADAENVLEVLKLHENVNELKLMNYVGKKFPDWINYHPLQTIRLKKCGQSDFFLVLGKLEQLKTFILEDMHSVTELSCDSRDDADVLYPALESLELHNMTKLRRMTGLQEKIDMRLLKHLTIINCEEMVELPPPIFGGNKISSSLITCNIRESLSLQLLLTV